MAGRKMRFAVVGLGNIAQVAVLPAFEHARESCELVALVSWITDQLPLPGGHGAVVEEDAAVVEDDAAVVAEATPGVATQDGAPLEAAATDGATPGAEAPGGATPQPSAGA